MRIGIDIDDTLSNTNDCLIDYAIKYDKEYVNGKGFKDKNAYRFTDMFYWTDDNKIGFYKRYVREVISNVPVKPYAKEVVNKLYDEGNYICIITRRNNRELQDPYNISKDWLDKNDIHYNKIIVESLNKGETCKEEQIDLFIDDLPNNCNLVKEYGIKVLLFDSNYNRDNKDLPRVNNWKEVYKIVSEVK